MNINYLNNFKFNNFYFNSQKQYHSLYNPNKQNKITRNLGIDLLRIVSMIHIIILHINSYSKFNLLDKESPKFKQIWFLNALSFWSVDGFAIISGVVGYKKYKFSNLIYIWIQSSFYSFIISFYFYYKRLKGIKYWLSSIFPIAIYKYWYVNAYFCMYILLPFINSGLMTLSQKFIRNIIMFYFLFFSIYNIIVLIFVNDDRYNFLNKGFSPLWLMILYISGGYIGKYIIIMEHN